MAKSKSIEQETNEDSESKPVKDATVRIEKMATEGVTEITRLRERVEKLEHSLLYHVGRVPE